MALRFFSDKVIDHAIEQTDFMPRQSWRTAALDVQTDINLYQWATLAQGPSPVNVVIDFSSVDANDHFIIRESILLDVTAPVDRLVTADGVDYKDGVQRAWHQISRFNIRTASGKLYINDVEGDLTRLAIVQPLPGPWHARVDIAHVNGISKPFRFLAFPG